MSSHGSGPAVRWGRVLFAACAACTLWLILQNTILLALLPQAWVPARLAALACAARVAVVWRRSAVSARGASARRRSTP